MSASDLGTLYRFYDLHGRLLYVGISTSTFVQRMRRHAHSQSWWDDVAEIQLEHVPVDMLRELERRAIVNERPMHNLQHNRAVLDRKPDRKRIAKAAPYVMSVERVARVLDCTVADIRWMVNLGVLNPVKIGRAERFNRDEVLRVATLGLPSHYDVTPFPAA
jgi:hypothetical protein